MKKAYPGLILIFLVAVGVALFRGMDPLASGIAGIGDSPASSTAAAGIPSSPSASLSLGSYPSELDALNSAYGGRIVSTQGDMRGHRNAAAGIEWKPLSDNDIASFGYRPGDKEEYWPLTTVLATSAPSVSSEEFVLLQTSTASAHIAQAVLGGAILAKDASGWKVRSLQKDIDTLGSFGDIPVPSVVEIGSSGQTAFRIDDLNGGQGYFSGPMHLYSFIGDRLENILTVDDAYGDNGGASDGEGAQEPYHYETRLRFVPGTDPRFDDIIATTDGTRASDAKGLAMLPVHRSVRYSFDGSRYHAVEPRIIPAAPYSFIVSTTSVEILWNGQYNQKIATDPGSTGYAAVEAGIVPEDKLIVSDMDVNFDGNPDLGILTGTGYGGVNYFYDFYLFDAKTGLFEKNPALRQIGNPQIDAAKKEVVSRYRSGPQWYSRAYRFSDGKYEDLGEIPDSL